MIFSLIFFIITYLNFCTKIRKIIRLNFGAKNRKKIMHLNICAEIAKNCKLQINIFVGKSIFLVIFRNKERNLENHVKNMFAEWFSTFALSKTLRLFHSQKVVFITSLVVYRKGIFIARCTLHIHLNLSYSRFQMHFVVLFQAGKKQNEGIPEF